MTKKRSKELRSKSMEELRESVHALRGEMSKRRAVISSGVRPENPGKINSVRKNIARHLTIMHEKNKSLEARK